MRPSDREPAGESKRTWKAVPFQDADLPAIGLFFKRHFPDPGLYGAMGLFQWRAVDHYITRGIINLIKDEGRIVSILSNTPKHLLIGGQQHLVAEIGDAFTDPEYQRQGMQTLLTVQSIQDAMERGIRGVYSTPDHQTPSLSAFINKTNFLPLEGPDIKSLVLPLNVGPLLRQRGHWLAAQYVGALHQTLAFIYFRLMKGLHAASRLEIVELKSLPADWDRFWEKCPAALRGDLFQKPGGPDVAVFPESQPVHLLCGDGAGRTRGIRGAPGLRGHREPDAHPRRLPLPAGARGPSRGASPEGPGRCAESGGEPHLHLVLLEESLLPVP